MSDGTWNFFLQYVLPGFGILILIGVLLFLFQCYCCVTKKLGINAVVSLNEEPYYRYNAFDSELGIFHVFSLNPEDLSDVPLLVGGRVVSALWDSGASVCYISQSTFKLLPSKVMKYTSARARAANGGCFNFLGEVDCKVQIGSHIINQTFLVSLDGQCPAGALFGYNFMNKLETAHGLKNCLSGPSETLTIGKITIFLLPKDRRSNKRQIPAENMISLK